MPQSLAASAIAPFAGTDVAAQTHAHRGQWVALVDGRVVCHALSPEEVYRACSRSGFRDPLVFKVPARPERLTRL